MDVVYAVRKLEELRIEAREIPRMAPLRDSPASLVVEAGAVRPSFEASPHGAIARGYAQRCGRAVLSIRPWLPPEIAEALEPFQKSPEAAWLIVIVCMAETTPCYPHHLREAASGLEAPGFLRHSAEAIELLQRLLAELSAEKETPAASEPGVVSSEAEPQAVAETMPKKRERIEKAMLAYRDATKQRAIDEARRAGRDSTAEHEGIEAGKAVESLSNTELGRALADDGRLEWPIDKKQADALRHRIGRDRKKLAKKYGGWKVEKAARPRATAGEAADARAGAGLSRERRLPGSDSCVRWCRQCGMTPAANGQDFCGPHMRQLSHDERQAILDGNTEPLAARLPKDQLELGRQQSLQLRAQAADERAGRRQPASQADRSTNICRSA